MMRLVSVLESSCGWDLFVSCINSKRYQRIGNPATYSLHGIRRKFHVADSSLTQNFIRASVSFLPPSLKTRVAGGKAETGREEKEGGRKEE